MTSEADNICVKCGEPVNAGVLFGLCGGCLVASAMGVGEEDEEFADILDSAVIEVEPGLPFERIGSYRLMRKIGEGAFGEVYAARQDEPVRRDVALKLLKRGLHSGQAANRFEAERQVLALMNHANVAAVFDGGESPGGRLFFVMELIDGPAITDFCRDRRLDLKRRLELFCDVCEGVRHAHQRGIIHRDLKPQNILVEDQDGRAVPKVIDFGIARLTEHVPSSAAMVTAAGHLVGTPAYMSPEQATGTGADIDMRSDVYSLGALLYQLLTGSPPFDNERLVASGYAAMERIITGEEPPRPSSRPTAMPGNPRIRGDLDCIVIKALEKDRERRYESPREFAADIRCFLQGEAVTARPPSTGYRLRKFVRRHKSLITSAAAVFVVLVAGIAVSVSQAVRAGHAERKAAERAAVSDSVYDFINDDLLAAALEDGPSGPFRFLATLQHVEERIEGRLGDHPLVEAGARLTLARAHLGMADQQAAERNARISLQLFDHHLDEPDRRTLGAAVSLARALLNQNQPKPALDVIEHTTERMKGSLNDRDRITALLLASHEEALGHLGRNIEQRLDLQRRLLLTRHTRRDAWEKVVASHQVLGYRALENDDFEEALRHCRKATIVAAFIDLGGLWLEPWVSNVPLRRKLFEAGAKLEQTATPVPVRIREWDLDAFVGGLRLPDPAARMVKAWMLLEKGDPAAAATLWRSLLPGDEPETRDHPLYHAHALMLESAGRMDAAAASAWTAVMLAYEGSASNIVPWYAANWSRIHLAADGAIDAARFPLSKKIEFKSNGHHYQRIEIPLSWRDAREVCEQLGGHLVVIDDESENKFVYGRFARKKICWLGASDDEREGTWKWVTGEPVDYSVWKSAQPSADRDDEDFAAFGSYELEYPGIRWPWREKWFDHPGDGIAREGLRGDPLNNILMTYAVCEWDE